jgi:hypothetical protein
VGQQHRERCRIVVEDCRVGVEDDVMGHKNLASEEEKETVY